jgi:hypothetical protein
MRFIMTLLRSEPAIFLATERCGSSCIRTDFPQAKCSQQIRGQHGFSIDCLDPLLASNLRHFQGNGVGIYFVDLSSTAQDVAGSFERCTDRRNYAH